MSSPHQSVPPNPSSHTEADEKTTEPPAAHVIRISRLGLLGVGILLFSVSFPALGWPAALGWLFLLPVLVTVWLFRTQTAVTDDGLDLRTVFGSRHLPWSQVKGVRFPKRGWARADLHGGGEVALPAVGFDRLSELAQASGGRIPDPFAPPPDEP